MLERDDRSDHCEILLRKLRKYSIVFLYLVLSVCFTGMPVVELQGSNGAPGRIRQYVNKGHLEGGRFL